MRLIEPALPRASLEQGFSYIKKGELGKAISVMDELIKADPYLAQAYWGRALCYECRAVNADDLERAIDDYSRSIVYAADPPALSYGRRGILYFKTGMYHEAIKDLGHALESDLMWAEAMFYRGRCYMALDRDSGDIDRAVEDFTGVIRISDSTFAPAYFWRAQAFRLMGLSREAVADYEKALEIDSEDVLALNALAYCSENGIGARADLIRAEELYIRAAELGFTVACKNLAWFYAGSKHEGQDGAERSAYWMRKAADNGDPEAQNLYGLRLRHGKGVESDFSRAARYFRLSAEQGYAPGMCNLADCREHGIGVEADPRAAFDLYKEAALKGDHLAIYNLGRHYYFGIGVEEDNDKAFTILKPLADLGHARAQDIVGMCYENGYGVERDLKLAGRYYRLAYGQGHAHAAAHLAARYRFGRGVRKNLAEAVRLYVKAGEMGSGYAWYALGRLYFEDKCDYPKAAEAFRKAAGEDAPLWLARALTQSDAPFDHAREIHSLLTQCLQSGRDSLTAAIFLSELEYFGFGQIPSNPEAAVTRLLNLIPDAEPGTPGLSCAYYFLARASELGHGCPRDAQGAARLYRKAEALPHTDGCRCFFTGLVHMLYRGVGCKADAFAAGELLRREISENVANGETRLLYVWSQLFFGGEATAGALLDILRNVARESPHDPAAAYLAYFMRRDTAAAGKYRARLRRALKLAPDCYRFAVERHLKASPNSPMYPLLTASDMDAYNSKRDSREK